MSINERYIVSHKTIYIEPKTHTNSVVMEKGDPFGLYVPAKPIDIIRESCCHYGKEFKYQKEMAKLIVGKKYMLPICISEQLSIVLIPTGKHAAENTYWIAYQHVHFSRDLGNGITGIHFKDGSEIKVPVSYNVWESKRNIGEKIFNAISKN